MHSISFIFSFIPYIFTQKAIGTLQGEVRDMDFESESEEEEEDVEERGKNDYVPQQVSQQKKKTGIFSLFKYAYH